MTLSIRWLLVCCALLLLSQEAPAASSSDKPGRPCQAKDLVGTWQMKSLLSKTEFDDKDPFVWRYQRMRFTDSGGAAQIVSEEPLERNPAALKKFEQSLTVSQYSVDARGVLSISKLDATAPEDCLCVIATRDPSAQALAKVKPDQLDRVPRKGDLLLTYLGRDRKPLLTKVFRKAD